MIINNNIPSMLKAYIDNKPIQNSTNEKMMKTQEVSKKDEIILSSQAQSFSHVLQKARNNVGVRQDKVDQISEKISAGQYQIDAKLIAEKMLANRY